MPRAWDSERMSMRYPDSLAARRAFCPSLPMASESWWSGTVTVAVPSSSSIWTSWTRAGLNASAMNARESSFHSTMSTFSPLSSFTTWRTRDPRAPTHAPTGSTFGSCDITAIFVRWPASLAMALISMSPSTNSGTSSSKSALMNSGWLRDRTIWGPLPSPRTSRIQALTRFPRSRRSYGIFSDPGRIASASPRSTIE